MKRTRDYYIQKLTEMSVAESKGINANSPHLVAKAIDHYKFEEVEHFLVLTVDTKMCIKQIHDISKGILNRTVVHSREVFIEAIRDRAHSIIIAHNHPSGDVTPSKDDDAMTRRLKDAGEILGIPVLDHIIIGRNGYYSYVESKGAL